MVWRELVHAQFEEVLSAVWSATIEESVEMYAAGSRSLRVTVLRKTCGVSFQLVKKRSSVRDRKLEAYATGTSNTYLSNDLKFLMYD